MKYLGLDLGERTLGIAISRSGIVANNYLTLKHDNNLDYLLVELMKIIDKEAIDIVVLGLPKMMNNSLGKRANISLEFKQMLEEKGVLVELQDERLSTKEANKTLIMGDMSRKKRKQVIDSLAATIILESYLSKKKGKSYGE